MAFLWGELGRHTSSGMSRFPRYPLVVSLPFTPHISCQGVVFLKVRSASQYKEDTWTQEELEGPLVAPLLALFPQGLCLLQGDSVLSLPAPEHSVLKGCPCRGVCASASFHLAFTCLFRYLSHFRDPLCLGVGMEEAGHECSFLKLIL